MSINDLINISLLILFLPLAGFATVLFSPGSFKKVYLVETAIITVTFLLAVLVGYYRLFVFNTEEIVLAFNWLNYDNLKVELGIKIDNFTVIMLFVVTLISMLVHYYSIEYMKGDSRFNRYFGYLGLFTFSMLGIVLTHNILMMYIFWELVGLSSYLLIGFWFEKDSAANAGKKAFLVNRVGDIGMFLGILIIFTTYGTFTFDSIFEQISAGVYPFGSFDWLTVAGFLIFLGAVGKSAQFPLHVWLPDAMEGPTPVSALIHAATMVAAGVYLTVRIFALLTPDALLIIASIGAGTSFLAATIAVTQNDIKKVLAYSTVSQLGYMVMAIGTGAFAFAFFHLVTHAFFKAALFLGSGSVIHSMHHEQDIRKMGGLRKKMPVTFYTFVIATAALCGIPFTSGFLSKDGLLAGSMAFGNLTGHWAIPVLAFAVAFLTAFYMSRLVILTFFGKPRDEHKYEHAHENTKLMTVPLIVLALLSLFVWFSFNPFDSGSGHFLAQWVKTPVQAIGDASYNYPRTGFETVHEELSPEVFNEEMHHAHYPAMILSLSLTALALLLAVLIYGMRKISADNLERRFKWLHNLSYRKWYVDEIYQATFIRGTMIFSRILNWFDAYIVDGIVNGSAKITKFISSVFRLFDTFVVDGLVNFSALITGFAGISLKRLQTGKVQTYIVYVIFSIIIILVLI